jgi:molybdopterin synthase sulfur carrier subunit
MQIRFFATIRECAGVSEVRWDEPTATLGELLEALSVRYGPTFRRWVLEKDDLGKAVIVVINGHDSRHQGGINASLHPDDTIAIFPAIAGGCGLAS